MPKWLSSLLIVIGFLALIALAILPRNVEVTVTTNVDESIAATAEGGTASIHKEPTVDNSGGGKSDQQPRR